MTFVGKTPGKRKEYLSARTKGIYLSIPFKSEVKNP